MGTVERAWEASMRSCEAGISMAVAHHGITSGRAPQPVWAGRARASAARVLTRITVDAVQRMLVRAGRA
jgi:hypothetical protein